MLTPIHFVLKSIFLVTVVYSQTDDPCNVYDILHLSEYRGENCTSKTSKKDICDSFIASQWYKTKDGSEILTAPPSIHSCATTFPIWMNGTFPEEGDGIVNRQACMVGIHSDCHVSLPVKVKNCTSYFVYHLAKPSACPVAYCFGQGKECPPIEPCDYYYHELLSSDTRNSECKSSTGDQNCDDLLPEEWYRLKSEDTSQDQSIPLNCPSRGNCGTKSPIWINGSNPSLLNEVVNRSACVHGEKSCCEKTYPIMIKNCSTYLVYYMKPVDSCPERYCFENHGECSSTTAGIPTKTDSSSYGYSSSLRYDEEAKSQGCSSKCLLEVTLIGSILGCAITSAVIITVVIVVRKVKRSQLVTDSNLILSNHIPMKN